MERCANTEALNKYLDEQERGERAYTEFISSIEPYLNEIEGLKKDILDIAKNYQGYDFTDDVDDLIQDL